jgi:hypothetical protein
MSIVVNDAETAPLETAPTEPQPMQQEEVQAPDVPEKYHGKSISDVIDMHQNAEKALGKRGQEVGDQRKLIDSLIQAAELAQHAAMPPPTEAESEYVSEENFYDDPAKAVKSAVDNHPDIIQAKQDRAYALREASVSKMEAAFPDFRTIVADDNFGKWVQDSAIRKELYERADGGFDFEAANELFGTWNQLNMVSSTREAKAKETTRRTKALRQTSTEGRSTQEAVGGKKMYRRSDLINLQVTDPNRYASLADEIQQAYAEGRVK